MIADTYSLKRLVEGLDGNTGRMERAEPDGFRPKELVGFLGLHVFDGTPKFFVRGRIIAVVVSKGAAGAEGEAFET